MNFLTRLGSGVRACAGRVRENESTALGKAAASWMAQPATFFFDFPPSQKERLLWEPHLVTDVLRDQIYFLYRAFKVPS